MKPKLVDNGSHGGVSRCVGAPVDVCGWGVPHDLLLLSLLCDLGSLTLI